VLLHIMLNGEALFAGSTIDAPDGCGTAAEPRLSGGASSPAQALVSALMEPDFAARLTAEQSLRHPWLVEHYGPLKGETDSDDTKSTRCAEDEGSASSESLISDVF